ncbi:MAG: hypothetical protein HXS46_11715 [Theionarchaea archaeon]|nr:MAG: hypothetical protein AYK18_13140 [Theionarchaea archaeon DG-70]MBU7011348.1 hypothetical protein [Theionarchaea archaeon]
MDVAYEDRKLHDDGICDGLMGYKEWFHYEGDFFVDEKPLTFVLGFVGSYPGWGALGWISYDNRKYSLAGNIKDKDHDGFYELQTLDFGFTPRETGYTLRYTAKPEPSRIYTGTVNGEYPHYTIGIQTPSIDVEVEMTIKSNTSVAQREIFPWMPCEKRIASWFHSGDITTSIKGILADQDITSASKKNRGWYERTWSKVIILWPSEWFFFMTHLDNGAVLDVYIVKSLGIQIHPLDECWLYQQQTFYTFSDYWAQFPETLEEAIKQREYSRIIGEKIRCGGKNGRDSFSVEATITDFRRYEFVDYYANIKYTNFVFETEGEALIDGNTIDMKGRGIAEWAPMKYWWL